MKATLVVLLIAAIATGCSMTAYESQESYLPEVCLVEAEEGGFHIEWDEPLRITRTITIEVQGYGDDGYKAWTHNGKPIDEVEIYLKRRSNRRRTFVFEPGSMGLHVVFKGRYSDGAVKFIQILTVEQVNALNARKSTEFEESRPHRAHATVQNFRIGDPQVLVLESKRLNP